MKDDDVAARLAEAKRLVSEGKFEIGNEAFKKGLNSVAVIECPHGLLFQWFRDGIGFGEIYLGIRNGVFVIDTECMGTEFVLDVIRQALEETEVRE